MENMKNKITKQMITELNMELASKGCPFRYEIKKTESMDDNPCAEITLASMSCVNSFIITPTKEFFDWLVSWFEVKGVVLSFNNCRSIFWSRYGWDCD